MALSKSLWYVINIKARTNQTPQHYFDTFKQLREENPHVEITDGKFISLMGVENFGAINPKTNIPDWVVLKIISYVIVDPNGFYDLRQRQNITIDWNADWVSNKKETEVLFCFSNHTLAVRKSSKITLNYIKRYFSDALAIIEPETFDVDVITDHGIIELIKNAHAIVNIQASISFSNPGHSKGFSSLFDDKIREANPESLDIKLNGTKTSPLTVKEDGMVDAIVDAAERDGEVTAVIKRTSGSQYEKIETSKHPRIVKVEGDRDSFWVNVWNIIKSLFP